LTAFGLEICVGLPHALQIVGFWRTAHLPNYFPTNASKGVTSTGQKNSSSKAAARFWMRGLFLKLLKRNNTQLFPILLSI
jgi:hypothetical protein